ncbi:unnamed protein product [Tenebrio molitor]|nr:unnamed protein product [Tenebrio molitor]
MIFFRMVLLFSYVYLIIAFILTKCNWWKLKLYEVLKLIYLLFIF